MAQPLALPEHGVTVAFVDLGNTKVELMEPLGEASPIAAFLARNPGGGMHHICFEVEDIVAARDRLKCVRAPASWATPSRISGRTASLSFPPPQGSWAP